MDDEFLEKGLIHGFLDSTIDADSDYIPKFLTNNPNRGEKVITSLKQEMTSCDSFMFSVAFVTDDGINALLSEFKYLIDHKIEGKILVSQYQNFTQPKALRKILSFPNIELRIVTEDQMRLHSKCYIFERKGTYDIIIGSSNLTNNALCSNGEWNLKFNSKDSGEVVSAIINEFKHVFEYSTKVTEQWIDEYSKIYYNEKKLRSELAEHVVEPIGQKPNTISPNKMQKEALHNLQELRDKGEDRALVISATGSGKTYLSAFDALSYGGKMLYIVHRNPILNKSMNSFKAVFGSSAKIERYDPKRNNLDADCLFATNVAMADDDVLKQVPADQFDYILIDEVHHIGANTYQKILNHFKPRFLMGMTATPDRTDGYDIYKFFNYNIAYDIRLKEAMEYKLICPFHYFGVSDIEIGDREYDDKTVFTKIEEEQRVEHVIKNAEFYSHCEGRLKGLVFCRNLKEAENYSTLFNQHGYRTVWVSGEQKSDYVNDCIERLESDEGEFSLDYIFTADLFNEGVDIPSINQVIMLRPTQSPIVYIQQLGRGLRIHKDKSYVVVLDFIGNYEKNYNIPLALSDDHSYNKSETRKFVSVGDTIIPGNSTISFDEISKQKIYESIDKSDFNNTKIIVEAYQNLKMKLGRIPRLIEFRQYGSIDALKIISKFKSYPNFLEAKDKEFKTRFSEQEINYLNYISKLIAAGKRSLEIEVLEKILKDEENIIQSYEDVLRPEAINNITSIFNGEFYKNSPRIIVDGQVTKEFAEALKNKDFLDQIKQLIDLATDNNRKDYSDPYDDTNFVLNKMYTYDDVCRFMNWSHNINAQNIGGYKYDQDTNTFCVFINYVKGEKVVESQRYEDHFENRNTLIALSKSLENKNSKNMVRVRDHRINRTNIHLFVRKNKDDEGSKEFYYLGKMDFESFLNDERPVKIRYKLREEIRFDLYEYFVR
ncbi:MAG: DUF3427 domain-containing protein [Thermoplasmata archaeon]|nr:DUF3427 domain-containing protein [Thermoplasmata archaeon]